MVAGFIVTGLGYGGAPTMGSAVISDFFGQKNYPVNFSINNMNLLVASFAGTIAGAPMTPVRAMSVPWWFSPFAAWWLSSS